MLKKMIGALLVLLLGFSAPAPAYSDEKAIQKYLADAALYNLNEWGYKKLIEDECSNNNLPVHDKVETHIFKTHEREYVAFVSFSSYVPHETAYKIAR